MEISEDIKEFALKKKCLLHPKYPCEIIDFSKNATNRRICIKCSHRNRCSYTELLSIRDLIDADSSTILDTFPPLRDQELHMQLQAQTEEIATQINDFIDELKNRFENAISKLQQEAKQQLIKRREMQIKIIESYEDISSIGELQQAVFANDEKADIQLESIIQNAWKNRENNSQKIQLAIEELLKISGSLSLNEPRRLAKQAILNIENIKLFQTSINLLPHTQFIKSTYSRPQQIAVKKNEKQHLLVENNTKNAANGQAFLDFIISPSDRYILNIELEQNKNQNKTFFFGLGLDFQKDYGWFYNEKMSYCEQSGDFGVNKQVKGPSIISGDDSMQKRSLEVKIHLQERLMKVSTLPNYESIVELDNQNLLDPKKLYRFFVYLENPQNRVTITKLQKVSRFDEILN